MPLLPRRLPPRKPDGQLAIIVSHENVLLSETRLRLSALPGFSHSGISFLPSLFLGTEPDFFYMVHEK